jgi:hypothetical protein
MHQLTLQCDGLGQCVQLVNTPMFKVHVRWLTLCHLLRSWIETSEGMDLTRSQLYGSSKNTTKVIPVNGKDRSIIIDTKRTLLCIIDMQSRSIYTVY